VKQFKKGFFFILILFCIGNTYSQKLSISESFSLDNFKIDKNDSFHLIKYSHKNDVKYFLPEGYPELPFISCYVLLPHHARITKILITGSKSEILQGTYHIRRSNPSLPVKGDYIFYDNPLFN